MDEHGIEQEERNRNTVTKPCNDMEYLPSSKIMKKAIDFAEKLDSSKKRMIFLIYIKALLFFEK